MLQDVTALIHEHAAFIDVLTFFWHSFGILLAFFWHSFGILLAFFLVWLFALFVTPYATLSVHVKVLICFVGEHIFCYI